jgi:hypothetical protein
VTAVELLEGDVVAVVDQQALREMIRRRVLRSLASTCS